MSLELFEGFEVSGATSSSIEAGDTWTGVSGVVTHTSYPRTGRSGAHINLTNGYARKTLSSTEDEVIIGCGMIKIGSGTGPACYLNDGGTTQVGLYVNGSDLDVYRGNDTGTLLGSTTGNLIKGSMYHFVELRVKIHNTAGEIELTVNGVQRLNLTSQDTQATANAYADEVGLWDPGAGANPAGGLYLDDVYVILMDATAPNSSIGDCKVGLLNPNGAGSQTNWTASAGSNYQCVDEHPYNDDTDYVSETTVTDKDSYAFEDLAETSPTIYGVRMSYRARKDDAGSVTMRGLAYVNSTNYYAATEGLADGYGWFYETWLDNPDTASAWTKTTLNGAEFGVELVS